MNYAVVLVRNFALHALRRAESGLAGKPLALVAGEGHNYHRAGSEQLKVEGRESKDSPRAKTAARRTDAPGHCHVRLLDALSRLFD